MSGIGVGASKSPMSLEKYYSIIETILTGDPKLPEVFVRSARKELAELHSSQILLGRHFELLTVCNLMVVVTLDGLIDNKSAEVMDKMPAEDWEKFFGSRVEESFNFLPQIVALRYSRDGSLKQLLKEAAMKMRRLLSDLSAPEWKARDCQTPVVTQKPETKDEDNRKTVKKYIPAKPKKIESQPWAEFETGKTQSRKKQNRDRGRDEEGSQDRHGKRNGHRSGRFESEDW